jgi:hypothetical protein
VSKTHVFERYDIACIGPYITQPSDDGQHVAAEAAINRDAVLTGQIRVLETQLKDAKRQMPIQFIVALGHLQAEFFANRAGWCPNVWQYVDDVHVIEGQRGGVLWVHETAERNDRFRQIMGLARAREMRLIPAIDFLT